MKLQGAITMIASIIISLTGCSNTKNSSTTDATADTSGPVPRVAFSGDSAYSYVEAQCSFGPRVPNTEAHRRCGDYLLAQLRRHSSAVTEQCVDLRAYDGTTLKARNFVAEFYPDKPKRILLLAHWDCRPWADSDADVSKHRQPVMGANDGASGVGVALEVARLLAANEPTVGVDILLTDAEDWGDREGDSEDSWALGTRYWASNPHREGYVYPTSGILLDMVGDANAQFLKEYFSYRSDAKTVSTLWALAAQLGHGDRFVNDYGGAITDDHVEIIAAGIPCIDIIDQRKDLPTGFCPQWHTTDDVMRHISPSTLAAVGETLTAYIFGMK